MEPTLGTTLDNGIGSSFVEGSITVSPQRRDSRNQRSEVWTATIGDRVFLDDNGNGIQDEDESGIGDVKVRLFQNGHLVATTRTNAFGHYTFDHLNPGRYRVGFDAPEGFSFTQQNVGYDDTIDSDADPHTGLTTSIYLRSGEKDKTIDAGLIDNRQPDLSVTWLGFDFDSDPNLEVLDSRIFDQDGDGDFRNDDGSDERVPFLTPKVGGTFTQRFAIKNEGGVGENITFTLQESSSAFVELIAVTGKGVSFDPETNTVTIASVGKGETITLHATSQVVDGDGTLTEAHLTYDLVDNPNDPNDFGNASAKLTQYWSATGFETASGETTFNFAEFAPSIVHLDLDGDGVSEAASDELQLLRLDGTLVEGEGGLEPNAEHKVFGTTLDGDTDARARAETSTRSTLAEGELSLAWTPPPGLDLTTFTELVADGTLDVSQAAYEEFLRLTNEDGIFAELYAVPTLVVGDEKIYTSEISGQRFQADGTPLGTHFSQEAVSGNIVNAPQTSFPVLTTVTYDGAPPSFQRFVRALDPEQSYRVIIENPDPIRFFNYSPDNPHLADIAVILLANDESELVIKNNRTRESLDLSETLIIGASGLPGGVKVSGDRGRNIKRDHIIGSPGDDSLFGGNNRDRLDGSVGDDILHGGKGSDKFVFANGTFNGLELTFGNDTISDFKHTTPKRSQDGKKTYLPNGRREKDIIKIDVDGLTDIPEFDQNHDGYINGADSGTFVSIQNHSLVLDVSSVGGGTITLDGVQSIDANSVVLV
ncbi:MAG: SdrD B-like domain-containing protein [Cyanobacteria bacterium P01_F01_bin.150]